MPKRLWFFLVAFAVIIGWSLTAPLVEREEKENSSLNSSLSTSPFGYKALYLLMSRMQEKPVTLWQHSMMNLPLDKPKTMWFIEPGAGMFFDGDEYAQHMKALVDRGYNFVFVLNSHTWDVLAEDNATEWKSEEFRTVLDFLYHWYEIQIEGMEIPVENSETFMVLSAFPSRQITTLTYEKPRHRLKYKSQLTDPISSAVLELPDLQAIVDEGREGKPLLYTPDGQVLAMRYDIGRGSITIVPNAAFFQNSQLDKGENAALAMAIQEQFGDQPILFEVYSSGFSDTRDVITVLASGKGALFLMTMVLLLGLFCIWLANRPFRKVQFFKTHAERQFTQEAFISALGEHFIATGRWHELYQKLLAHFQHELERRYPGHSPEERLSLIAESPFVDVSLKELEEVFTLKRIDSEEAFVSKSRHLLQVQRKVCRYEHSTARAYPSTAIRR